jgi:Fe2+ or Zn2+ uptake regulation protein
MAETPLERFERFLADRGQRLTVERSIVARTVLSMRSGFDPDQLLDQNAALRISRATAFRTLSALTSAGLVRELPGSGNRFFVVEEPEE